MKRTIAGLLGFATVVLLTSTVPKVEAASKQPFEATFTVTAVGAPERSWVDEENVVHVRKQPFTADFAGDITGVSAILFNANIDALGNGDTVGTFTITTEGGIWECSFDGIFTSGVHTGSFVCHGTGGLDRMKLMGTFAQISPPGEIFQAVFQGTILDPHG